MATSAQWGDFEWGNAEWGSIEASDASPWGGTIALTVEMDAALTVQALMAASLALTVTMDAEVATQVLMVADLSAALSLSASLKVGRFAGHLARCGNPLSTAYDGEFVLQP